MYQNWHLFLNKNKAYEKKQEGENEINTCSKQSVETVIDIFWRITLFYQLLAMW